MSTSPPLGSDRLLRVPFDGLSDDDRIRKVQDTFDELMVGEIKRILVVPGAPAGVAAMILCCCAIEFCGTLCTGKNGSDATFKEFVKSYLGQAYDPGRLRAMRNSLIHNYCLPPGGYVFTAGSDKISDHLELDPASGRTWIIVDRFVSDIVDAGARMFADAAQPNHSVRASLLKRTRKPGLLSMHSSD